MPLNPATLLNAILRRTDQTRADFVGFPADNTTSAMNWAMVASEYYRESVAPFLAPVTSIGEQAFTATYLTQIGGTPGPVPLGLLALDTSFQAYVIAVAGAVLSIIPGSITTPPVGLPGIPGLLTVPTSDPVAPATTLSTTLDLWSRTGTFALNALVAPVPWN